MYCKWVVREGTNNTYWAFTPCKKGFNPLTRVNKKEHIRKAYENCLCPICGKKIHIDMCLIENEINEGIND